MSTTLNQLSYDLLLTLSGGTLSDDFDIDKRQVYYWIANTRARLLSNELNRNRSIHPVYIQDLGCVGLETVDRAECCDIDICCDILRTDQDVPAPVELYNKETITRVASLDKIEKPYTLIPYARAPYVGSGRFNSQRIFAFYRNNRVYLVFNSENYKAKLLQKINIQGVFEDPSLAAAFTNCDGSPCWTPDSQYPISKKMVNYLKNEILKSELNILKIPSDTTNDGADSNNTEQ